MWEIWCNILVTSNHIPQHYNGFKKTGLVINFKCQYPGLRDSWRRENIMGVPVRVLPEKLPCMSADCEDVLHYLPLFPPTPSLCLRWKPSLLSCPAFGHQNSRIFDFWLAGLASVVLGSQFFSFVLQTVLYASLVLRTSDLDWTTSLVPQGFQLVDGPWWEFLRLQNCIIQLAYQVLSVPPNLSFLLENIDVCSCYNWKTNWTRGTC